MQIERWPWAASRRARPAEWRGNTKCGASVLIRVARGCVVSFGAMVSLRRGQNFDGVGARLAAMHKGLFLGRLSYGALAGVLVRVGESTRRSSIGIGKVSEVHLYSDLAALCVPAFLLV